MKGGTDIKVERICWKIEQNSGGGPRNPDPSTTCCLALDFGGFSKSSDAGPTEPRTAPCGNQRDCMEKEGKEFEGRKAPVELRVEVMEEVRVS